MSEDSKLNLCRYSWVAKDSGMIICAFTFKPCPVKEIGGKCVRAKEIKDFFDALKNHGYEKEDE